MAVVRCFVCKRRFESELSPALPFCSERCRRIDLGRWLGEGYGLPHLPDDESEGRELEEPEPED